LAAVLIGPTTKTTTTTTTYSAEIKNEFGFTPDDLYQGSGIL
jgi:hypothetical protein